MADDRAIHIWAVEPAYPAPRTKRSVPAAGAVATAATVALPRTSQIVLVAIVSGSGLRSTAVSRRLVGPGLIKSIAIDLTTNNTITRQGGASLRWGPDNSGAGSSVATNPMPSGAPVFETTGDPSTDPSRLPSSDTYPPAHLNALTRGLMEHRLDYIVNASEFFLKGSILNTDTATIVGMVMRVTVYENVDPELMLDLIG